MGSKTSTQCLSCIVSSGKMGKSLYIPSDNFVEKLKDTFPPLPGPLIILIILFTSGVMRLIVGTS